MDQDDLEGEILWKAVMAQLELAKSFFNVDNKALVLKTVIFVGSLVVLIVFAWLARSRHGSLRWIGRLLLLHQCDSAGGGIIWEHEDDHPGFGSVGAFAMQGRRPGMEDRFHCSKVNLMNNKNKEVVFVNAVMDGHGGEFAVRHVKRNLVRSLELRIRMLKALSKRGSPNLSKRDKLRMYVRLSREEDGEVGVSKAVLDYLEVTEAEYKQIDPKGQVFGGSAENDLHQRIPSVKNKKKEAAVTSTPILSSRVKPLEELPTLKQEKPDESSSSSLEDLLCLSYSTDIKAIKSNNKVKKSSKKVSPSSTDLTEYLTPTGDILYSKLLRDEIEREDRKLLSDAKKAGEIGGKGGQRPRARVIPGDFIRSIIYQLAFLRLAFFPRFF